MAHAFLQSTCLPSSVSWANNKQIEGDNRTRKAPTMLCSSRLTPTRIQSFIGLRGVNALDVMFQKSGPSLQSMVKNATTLTKQRRKQRMAPPRAMFERFTEKAIKVIMLSQDEARRLGHNFVGTEQILLGLIGEGTGIAAKVLKSTGITLKEARVEVEKIIGRGSGFVPVEIPFTPRAKRVLELSLEEARQLGRDCEISFDCILSNLHGLTTKATLIHVPFESGNNYIGSEHLLLGLLREGEGVAARVLESLGADLSNIRAQVIRMVGESAETIGAGVGGGSSGSKMPTLEEFGTNLTMLAEEGKLDPVVGRAEQVERVTQILGRRTKNNPCLIGEPGVGKTAIAEGLAQRIANGDVPETIEGKKVITLDMGRLVAGTKYRGEFEERLKKLMEEIKQSDDIILFIDEVHTLIGAGAAEGAIDAANILKPALARGELQCIGATTLDEYRKHIEKDPALERRFQPVKVPEPTVEEAIQILRGLRERYEIHHKLRYTDEAIVAAAELSHQYISDRFLPDKAIDLIDEAGSRVRLHHAQLPEEAKELERELRQITTEKNEAVRSQDFEKAGELRDKEMDLRSQMSALVSKNKEATRAESESGDGGPTVTEADIHRIVSSWTGIPVDKVSSEESSRLLRMESTLHGRVVGQDEAVEAISRAIRRARVGLKNPNRPIASFIFSGPTGVGKSELAKALAAYYFGSEDAMVRLDMSEFMERHTVSKLIGSPPGYVGYSEGGQLTEAVRRRPYTLVLFDEIEKAHPDVFNMMLQILEDGRLTDGKGRTVDFKNTLLIMTSNIGSSVILEKRNKKPKRRFGFQLEEEKEEEEEDRSYKNIKKLVMGELKDHFRPEFLNRLDDMIVFRQLTKEEVKEIGDIMLKEVVVRLKKRDIELQVTDRFRDRVVEEGYSPSYGARPLRRAIMRLLEDSMAEKMLASEIKEGDSVIVDVDSDGEVVVLSGAGAGAAAFEASPDLVVTFGRLVGLFGQLGNRLGCEPNLWIGPNRSGRVVGLHAESTKSLRILLGSRLRHAGRQAASRIARTEVLCACGARNVARQRIWTPSAYGGELGRDRTWLGKVRRERGAAARLCTGCAVWDTPGHS
ncbi:ATP-dependent Clp protease ATP-binding subunit ClpA [Striga asiatica]|uniref:ATP-dependent Clp protease ATP-binding subunit ClpA n=1 Tax=Striga asiatica TaxID=4170 RepID=A0A5A7PC49_STRAF|nr:ATP-dependent Clp protease ATP-binding subunit ClpA [Striga asiatica]